MQPVFGCSNFRPSLLILILFVFLSVDFVSFVFFSEQNLSQFAPFYLKFSSSPTQVTTTITNTKRTKINGVFAKDYEPGIFETNSERDTESPKIFSKPELAREDKFQPNEQIIDSSVSKSESDNNLVALLNIHLGKKDGKKWQRTTIEDNCIGLYTFISTYPIHKMNLLYFHNHEGPLPCNKIIDTFDGTNVRFVTISNEWFANAIETKLTINITKYWGKQGGNKNTAICDFKPLYGIIFEDFITSYRFWGYGDVDGLFGNTETLFNDLYQNYDTISGYCNTNWDQDYPTFHQCGRGYAAGPLMLLRNSRETTDLLMTALSKWWREYFKVPKKFFLDEDFEPHPKHPSKYHTLHKILKNKDIDHNLRQYCDDSCQLTENSDEVFIFNLAHHFTDYANVTYRWSRKNGITIWANQTSQEEGEGVRTYIFRPHFLHWSLWKYSGQAKIRKLRRQIFAKIKTADCLEFYSLSYRNFFRGGLIECEE